MIQRFDHALQLAMQAHSGQFRKGTNNAHGIPLPYITHPVTVAMLVQRYNGNEAQIIAALLHDVLEDAGAQWAHTIRSAFGDDVLALVEFCTDGVPNATGKKPPWRERKNAYLDHLRGAQGPGLLVSACDKLANLQSIRLDLIDLGDALWLRFTGGKDGSLWYYQALVDAFADKVPTTLHQTMRAELDQVMAQVG
jgi:(p)ppGpp synthase/HD superfamily hydrolase